MNNEFLIRRAKKDDKDAFCRLMDEHLQCMYKMASAYLKNDEDVADAIQDTILSCYENLKSLKQNRYFKTWMLADPDQQMQGYSEAEETGHLHGSDAGDSFL